MTGFRACCGLVVSAVEKVSFAITYLGVSSNCEATIVQLLSWQVRQNIGKVSRNVRSGSERNTLAAIPTDGYFPTCNVEVHDPAPL